jgi:hypothetical protein|nr:MAG TPA: hypothetical protein [Caudoviricetes sp.]
MNDLITIGNTQFTAKTLDGKPVLAFRDIDAIHHRPEGSASRNFRSNRQRFIEGEDFFTLDQPDEIRRLGFERPQGGTPSSVTLVTESGYLMIVKSFTDDWAWEVQRKLVKTYFRAKDLAAKQPKPMSTNDLFELQLKINREYESKLNALEERADDADRKISTITDVFAAAPTDEEHWRDVMNRKVRAMCEEYGLNYHTTIGEMYAELERRAHVNLATRQKNLRERMRLGGAKYAQREAVSKLVVISQDAKLRYIYEAIVREKAAQLAASRMR